MSNENWVDVIDEGDVGADTVCGVSHGGLELAVIRAESGEVYVIDNICTHGQALLSDGFLDGTSIECPLHGGCFDVVTGKGLCAPIEKDIGTYKVRSSDGKIQILLDG